MTSTMTDGSDQAAAAACARRLWRYLEPLHAILYFGPECQEALKDAGARGFRMAYFGARSAPMGPVAADVVIATFFNFAPPVVRRAIPDTWTFSSPEALLQARLEGADRTLRAVLGDEVDGEAVREAADIAEAAVDAVRDLDSPGRPLFAGNAALPAPAEPHLRLWQAATALREHRGDGHVACLTRAGYDGCEALATAVAAGSVPRAILQPSRAWTDGEWEAAVERLVARGLLNADGTFTDAGRAARQQIEDDTDRLGSRPYAAIGLERAERLGELARGLSRAVVTAGLMPRLNPIGLDATEA